jgi:hypothetical protein
MRAEPAWFLLYEGSSPDGRGTAEYVGRTTDPVVARAHHAKVSSNPYSTGYVQRITDGYARMVRSASEIE